MSLWQQVCSAGSRAIVQEGVAAQLVKKIKERMGRLRVGDSLDKCIDMGPIVHASQMKSIDHFVQQAKQEGAEVMSGCGTDDDNISCLRRCSNQVLASQLEEKVISTLPR